MPTTKGEANMKFSAVLALVLGAVLAFGSVVAAPPGKPVVYAGGPMGKVTFDGKIHADKGLKCADCHVSPKLFEMKKVAKITMADMNSGKNCGTCHDGKKAFKSSDAANCSKCHKK